MAARILLACPLQSFKGRPAHGVNNLKVCADHLDIRDMCIVYSMLAILWIHARECATVETHTNIHEHCNFVVPKGESLVALVGT